MGFSLTPSPHLSDKQDTFQEHVVLVVLIHGLLIHKVPGLQIRVVWEQQRAPGFRMRHTDRVPPRPGAIYTYPGAIVPPVSPQHLTLREQ